MSDVILAVCLLIFLILLSFAVALIRGRRLGKQRAMLQHSMRMRTKENRTLKRRHGLPRAGLLEEFLPNSGKRTEHKPPSR